MNLRIFFILAFLLSIHGCKNKKIATSDKSGSVEINGSDHYYNLSGKGDTLVILHGGPGFSHKYMKPQLDALLSPHFTLIYYDQRGSGWSGGEKDSLKLNIKTYVQDLEQIRNYFDLQKMNLLGHSFGGLLAMHYAVAHPANVNSLILVDTDAASYELRTPYQVKMINSRLSEAQQEYLDSLENTSAFQDYSPETYENYYKTFLTSYFKNSADTAKLVLGFDSISVPKINTTNYFVRKHLGNYDIHDQLFNIKSKTLIMQGTESVFSVEGAMAIKERIPNSELHLFEDTGHFEYIESPKKFKELILRFYNIQK